MIAYPGNYCNVAHQLVVISQNEIENVRCVIIGLVHVPVAVGRVH